MKKRFFLSIALVLVTIVAMGQRINLINGACPFDLKDEHGNSIVLAARPKNATAATSAAAASPADMEFIYLAGTSLANLTPVATAASSGFINDPLVPTDFSSAVIITTQNGAGTSFCKYKVSPQPLTPVPLPKGTPFKMDFTSPGTGWAMAILTQATPSITGISPNPAALLFDGPNGVSTVLGFTDVPDVLSYKIARSSDGADLVLAVSESINGIEWSDPVKTYQNADIPVNTSVPTTPETINLKSSTRFVKFTLTGRTAGNLWLFDVSVSAKLQDCRITAFDLQDASNKSLILGYNAANATGVWDNASATAAALDFIYKAGTDLSNVNLVTTIDNSAFIVDVPVDFRASLPLQTQNGTESPYAYSLYNVTPRQLTSIELPATPDITTAFSSTTKGWAQARLGQSKPSNMGSIPSLSYPAAGVFTLLSFSNAPAVLSFGLGTSQATGNVFDVLESTDGITWDSPTASFTDIPLLADAPTATPFSVNLKSTTRFVKLILSTRGGGNFYLFDISVTAAANPGTGMSNTFATATKVFAQNGLLNIVSNEAIANLEIFALNGQLLAKVGNPANQVNIAGLSAGCYIAKLKNADGQTVVCRFVK